jgi:spore germination protein YaaH
MATLSYSAAASASTRALPDPVMGPNAQQDALYRTHTFAFTPAGSTTIQPRRSRAAVAGPANPASPGTFSNTGGLQREVLGFAPYWELSNNANWNYSLLSTVAYFGLDIDGNGNFITGTKGASGWGSQDMVDMINRAHAAGDRVVLVIKQFDEATINRIVTTPSASQAAINNTIYAIGVKNLDGVNVDFEGRSDPAYPNIQSGFTNFMAQLSLQVHQRWPGAYVTADTYSGSASWDGGMFNIGQLAPVVDGLFVMAYDMASGNMSTAGPNAPLSGWTYNDTTSISQYLTKAPASKVILGVPYYGYKYCTVDATPYSTLSGSGGRCPDPAQPDPSLKTRNPVSDTYADILSDLGCAQQLTKSWDTTAQSPWASWWSPATADPCGGNHGSWRELYYDDATSLGYKYDLVNGSNLQGTGVWALGYDGTSTDLWKELALKFFTDWPGQFHPLAPSRIVDTRDGTGGYPWPLNANQSIDFQVTGRGGIPTSGVAAVVMNVTAVWPTRDSYLTVYPTATPKPTSSNVNFPGGQSVPNLVQVAVGKGGKVSVYNFTGSTHVVLDVQGWISTATTTSGNAGRYQPLAPARLLDTREGAGTPLGQGQTIDVQVSGQGQVAPTGASAVALNLTVIGPTNNSFVTAYPTGSTLPPTSNLNFITGQTVANRAIVPVGNGGKVTVYNRWGQTHVVVDVAGWFTDSSTTATGGQFTGLAPARIVDTRTGLGGHLGRIGVGTTVFSVAAQAGVPAMTDPVPPTAVVLNLTVTDATASSYLTVYPGGASPPTASDINFTPWQTRANLVIARLNSDGTISVYNFQGAVNVIVDVFGYVN